MPAPAMLILWVDERAQRADRYLLCPVLQSSHGPRPDRTTVPTTVCVLVGTERQRDPVAETMNLKQRHASVWAHDHAIPPCAPSLGVRGRTFARILQSLLRFTAFSATRMQRCPHIDVDVQGLASLAPGVVTDSGRSRSPHRRRGCRHRSVPGRPVVDHVRSLRLDSKPNRLQADSQSVSARPL